MPEKPIRPSMSKVRRARIFDQHKGVCELCGLKIMDGVYDIEHRIPWAISYDDGDSNLYPAHRDCHKFKTAKQDAKTIAKTLRMAGERGSQYAKRAKNGSTMKSRPFPKGSRKIESRPFEKRKK